MASTDLASPRFCSIAGCQSLVLARSLCQPHYRAAKAAGGFTPRPRYSKKLSLAENLAALSRRDDATGCLMWIGHINPKGYGEMKIAGRNVLAHRAAYEEANGPLPPGMLACHHCDTPACIELDHLFAGTTQDNNADKIAKGRHPRGERSSAAKLTEGEVRAIRNDPRSDAEVAAIYEMSDWTIRDIRRHRIWRHVA